MSNTAPHSPTPCSRPRRIVLILAGSLFIVLAGFGAILPILPTTPFLLLAAACYLRSSHRLYKWLLGNRLFGEYLRRYRAGEGLPLKLKIWTVVVLWLSLAASAFWAVPARLWWVRVLLALVGIGVSLHLAHLKTWRPDAADRTKLSRAGSRPAGVRCHPRQDTFPTESR
jgi:uncharacterized membrane protein YbaN (DUF454 family)